MTELTEEVCPGLRVPGKSSVVQKTRDYRSIVILQASLIILGLTLSDFLSLFGPGRARTFIYLFFLLIGPFYMFSLLALLRDLSGKKWLYRTVFFLLIFIYLLAVLLENPVIKVISLQDRPPFLFLIHFSFLAVEILVIFTAVKDIFSFSELSSQKLWGSASIFMMIAISFASVYDLIIIARPDAFGRYISPGFSSYAESVYYSLKSLLKLESVYPDAIKLVHNIGAIEAVTGELFVALLIGNLLSKREI